MSCAQEWVVGSKLTHLIDRNYRISLMKDKWTKTHTVSRTGLQSTDWLAPLSVCRPATYCIVLFIPTSSRPHHLHVIGGCFRLWNVSGYWLRGLIESKKMMPMCREWTIHIENGSFASKKQHLWFVRVQNGSFDLKNASYVEKQHLWLVQVKNMCKYMLVK